LLRVIAGRYGGRKLCGARGFSFRPTLDRVKESIFNVLGDDVIGRKVADLFCGTGSLGIEAISRGALRATFIDVSKTSLDIARKNAALLGIESQAEFIRADILGSRLNPAGMNFDLVFADPPYDLQCGNRLVKLLLGRGILAKGGLFVYEHQAREEFDSEGLRLLRNLKFGQTVVDIFASEE